MADTVRCEAGDWVEVSYVLLEPADRSVNLPPETAAQQLIVWVKGFARDGADVGEELTVETMTGRSVTGVLTDVNPGYEHTFGRPTPELTHVGADLRARVAAYRVAADASAASPKAGE
ncbi:MAG: 2-amino-4-oxopentanoate thiolase subunit OrtA [Coriobacteriia bacterium]|nr:2-amino-4-oxopentanoate thiolase subunit OrtA [Coriobacteriia bacterium]